MVLKENISFIIVFSKYIYIYISKIGLNLIQSSETATISLLFSFFVIANSSLSFNCVEHNLELKVSHLNLGTRSLNIYLF